MKISQNYMPLNYFSGFFNPIFQVFKSLRYKQVDLLIFLILPVIYLLNATAIHYYLGAFFLGSVDPEYFYLYNGVVLSGGNLSIQYFAHPGTPLHFIVAISSRIISLFQPGDYAQNVVDDPELFIHAANQLMNVLVAIVLFICGILTRKYSGSYFAGLMMQLSPFGSSALWGLSGRLIPESLLIIPLLFMGLMIIKHIYSETKSTGNNYDIVLYGLLIGFGIACKLSFIPIILIPLVLLQTSVKQKVKLILYTILFFAIFAYPVVFNINEFWHWVSGMFTHSGKYGAGNKNIIDLSSIPGNFKYLLSYNKELFFVAGISLMLSALFSLKIFKNKGFNNPKIIRAILAINIAILVCGAFTLKHFALYYFMPFSLFKYMLILLSALLIVQFNKISNSKKYKTITLLLVSGLVFIITYGQIVEVKASILNYKQRNEMHQQQYKNIMSLVEKDKPIIMTCPYYGSPFIEFAHFNGFLMSRHLKGYFTKYLKEKYPLSYQYVSWSDKFYFWDDFVDIKGILAKSESSFYIYIGKSKGSDLPIIENRVWQFLDKNEVTRKVLYQEEKSDEQLIEISLNSETK